MKRGVVVRSAWKMARAYWLSNEKVYAWTLLIIVITLNLTVVSITVLINKWHGIFYEAIQNYNYNNFFNAVIRYAGLAALLVFIRGYQIYTRMLLHIKWRKWLTERFLSEWLKNKTYYRLQLFAMDAADNPDQRICEDVELFVSLTLRLSLDLLQDAVTIISFIIILWDMSGVIYLSIGQLACPIYGYLVWAAIVYSGIGTIITVKLGKPLVKYDFDQQRYEANFRFGLVRVRENAECIAFYNGEKQEFTTFWRCFKNIVDNYMKIITIRRKLMWLTASYSQISVIFAILVASPRYFQNKIHLGQMFQVIDAYHHVQNGFSFIIDSFTRLAQWRAAVNRLNSFSVCMGLLKTDPAAIYKVQVKKNTQPVLVIGGLNVYRPEGAKLINNLKLNLNTGERLIITGPSGCGKSTLLRTIAGLWPHAEGCIASPAGGQTMFVPQKAYMPLDILREVILYPGTKENVSDGLISEMLYQCGLSHLTGKLHEFTDWGQALSLGEQQRIAFVRILLQKPNWLFLDEATSALDEKNERQMYHLVAEIVTKTSVISVGHRPTLLNFHHNRLEIKEAGEWALSRI